MKFPITKDQALDALRKALRGIQTASGRRCPDDLTPGIRPIGDIDGFDSLNGVETTVLVEQELDCSLGKDNLFVSEDGSRPLQISEIAELICRHAKGKAA